MGGCTNREGKQNRGTKPLCTLWQFSKMSYQTDKSFEKTSKKIRNLSDYKKFHISKFIVKPKSYLITKFYNPSKNDVSMW